MNKRRHEYGSKSPNAKLTEEQAREIKFSKTSNVRLGKKYGISPSKCSEIKHGKAWKHLEATP